MKKILVLAFLLIGPGLFAQDDQEVFDALDKNDSAAVLRGLERLRVATGDLMIGEDRHPAALAFLQNKKQLGKDILKRYPELLNRMGHVSRYAVRTPFFAAVELDDLELCRWLVAEGADIRGVYYVFDRPPLFQVNALAFARSAAMTDYLKTFDLPLTYEISQADSQAWTSNDSKVNLRASSDTKGAVLAQLKKGESVFYLGNTTFLSTVNGQENYWIKVKTKAGVVGWVFGDFLTNPWTMEE